MHFNIPIFIPHLACPFTCVFCNQKHISGHHKPLEPIEIINKIEQNLATIDIANSHIEVGLFGGSFTCLEIKEQRKYLEMIQPFVNDGLVKSIRISTRPDFIDERILEFLKSMNVRTIELGVQSMDNDVLLQSGRGHTAEDVFKAASIIKSNGFELGLQMMVGLPGDTLAKSIETTRKIIAMQPESVRIYPTLVINNTKLAELYLSGFYHALTIEEAIEWVAPCLKLFIQNGINVIRVGLHSSKEFESDEILLAGPHHPSFRELVMTRIWNEEFIKILDIISKDITITIPSSEYNNAIGFKAYNKIYLKQKFNRVRFKRSAILKGLEFNVDYN